MRKKLFNMDTQQFTTGFNNGYLIAKHEPILLSKIEGSLTQANSYLEGFSAGKEQFSHDLDIDRLRQLRDSKKDMERDR